MLSGMVRARLFLIFFLVALVAGGCNRQGAETVDDPSAEDLPAAPPQPSPEELAAQFSVPVPEGGSLESAEADPNTGEANFELLYQGPPDVDSYTSEMEGEGWEIVDVEAINSFRIQATHSRLVLEATVLYLSDQRIEWEVRPGARSEPDNTSEDQGDTGGEPEDGGGFDY
jgi:hypothetical protein